MAGFHCVQSAMHAGSRPRCLLHLQHRRIMIYWYICHTDCHWKKPYHADVLRLKRVSGSKKRTAKTTLLPGCSSHVCSASPCDARCQKKNPLRNNNKTAATAGVGRVQLNFQTAGRDQRWKSIFCSNTRPASIIQRRVPLGDLSLSPSPALLHADSLWLARPQQQTLPLPRLLRCSWRFQDFFYFLFFSQVWHLKCLKCLACRSHTLPVFFSMHLSWLGGKGGGG